MLRNSYQPRIIHDPSDQARAHAVTVVSSDETATSGETALVKTEPCGRGRSYTLGNWTPPPASNLTNGRTEEVMTSEEMATSKARVPVNT